MAIGTEEIPKTYAEAVSMLTRWHAESGPTDLQIYWFPDPDKQVVQLVEVSGDFQATGQVSPFVLGRSNEFPFTTAVALVTPEEWEAMESGRMPLPDRWLRDSLKQVWP